MKIIHNKRKVSILLITLIVLTFGTKINVQGKEVKSNKKMRSTIKSNHVDKSEGELTEEENTFKEKEYGQTYKLNPEEQIETKEETVRKAYEKVSEPHSWSVKGILDNTIYIIKETNETYKDKYIKGLTKAKESILREYIIIENLVSTLSKMETKSQSENHEKKRTNKRDHKDTASPSKIAILPQYKNGNRRSKNTEYSGDESKINILNCIKPLYKENVVSCSAIKIRRCIKRYQTIF
ncbi:hypothetical protein [Oceanirhabdus sp. W0125-5]|uniref:hypothetical protein n=1 Tax=Oceanirhabdus sp. W0125-5 TaxID=2999116 RepID=UPI0022F342A2|nr:hypothetical protein [Oceanirhabdus sp. W0125-5]WBW95950.1 hypothetical protein OW730_19990 [Oceanirhabdus sp. W0125-5]